MGLFRKDDCIMHGLWSSESSEKNRTLRGSLKTSYSDFNITRREFSLWIHSKDKPDKIRLHITGIHGAENRENQRFSVLGLLAEEFPNKRAYKSEIL